MMFPLLSQLAFDARICECLELHTLAVKSLRYPDTKAKMKVETIEEQREREQLVIILKSNQP